MERDEAIEWDQSESLRYPREQCRDSTCLGFLFEYIRYSFFLVSGHVLYVIITYIATPPLPPFLVCAKDIGNV